MKTLLLLCCLSAFSVLAFAQQFTVEFDSMSKTGSSSQSEIICYNHIINNTTDTLTIRWVRIEKGFPTGWKSQICDLNLCYWFDVNTKPFKLSPSATGNLDIHFWPEDVVGEGQIDVLVFIEGDSAATVQVSNYKGSAFPVGISPADDIEFIIKPNPVKDVFTLIGIETFKEVKVQIFDLIGNTMDREIDLSQPYINVSDLPKGFYFMQLSSGQLSYIKTIRFEKL